MVKLSVCVEMFWKEQPMEERVRRAKRLGYPAFEFWGWKNKEIDKIRAAREETGLALAAMCLEPNFCLVEYGNDRELVEGTVESAKVARTLGCTTLIATTGDVVAGETWETTRRRVVRKLREMAKAAADAGATIVVEPLNPVVNHKGYWLTTAAEAADVIADVGSPALKMLFDCYHQQLTEGNLTDKIRRFISIIGHFHTAGVPGRHELGASETDYRFLFKAIGALDYPGFVGLEFSPTIGDEAALEQALSLLK